MPTAIYRLATANLLPQQPKKATYIHAQRTHSLLRQISNLRLPVVRGLPTADLVTKLPKKKWFKAP